tara:strand:- start:191 stop:694 length:504 start_codon:yes stop_codon:yes gene_type:complete
MRLILGLVALTLTITAPLHSAPRWVNMDLHRPVPGVSDKQVECLAKNIYFEARNQSEYGKFAVANVTMNRVKDPRFPNTICDVVFQGPRVKKRVGGCQFSWYCDGKPDKIYNKRLWKECKRIAVLALLYPNKDITIGATHYHASYVNPWWAKKLQRLVTVGDHIFYR